MTSGHLGIEPPPPPPHESFRLVALGPEHNERDHAAWMSSIEFIRTLPGFAAGDWQSDAWPYEMPLERNLDDLVMHRREFEERVAFAYTVLAGAGDDEDVIGCVYVDADDAVGAGDRAAMVRSWVRASHGELDETLAQYVDAWLRSAWPLTSVRWPGRLLPPVEHR